MAGKSSHGLRRGQRRRKHSGAARTRSLRTGSKELTSIPSKRGHFGWYLCCERPERSRKKQEAGARAVAGAKLRETEKQAGRLLSPPPTFVSPSSTPYLQNLPENQLAQKNPNANQRSSIYRGGSGIERQRANSATNTTRVRNIFRIKTQ